MRKTDCVAKVEGELRHKSLVKLSAAVVDGSKSQLFNGGRTQTGNELLSKIYFRVEAKIPLIHHYVTSTLNTKMAEVISDFRDRGCAICLFLG